MPLTSHSSSPETVKHNSLRTSAKPTEQSVYDELHHVELPCSGLIPLTSPDSTQPKKLRATVIRLLANIDRKLGLLIRGQDSQFGDLLTIAQAAEASGVSTTTIRRAIRLSDGPDRLIAYDQSLGRKKATWRIDLADLDAWRKRRERRPPAPSVRTVRASSTKTGHFRF